MVRHLLLSIAVTFLGTFVWADTDSWRQTCRSEKGQFSVIKDGQEDHSLCFFGETGIGAEALYLLEEEGQSTDSIRAYKNRKSSATKGGVCGAFDAELVTAKDASGQSYNLCRFADNSVMEETTLWLGPGSINSDVLDKALSKIR